ncbi:hypothetical protein [Sphingopyxis sp. LC363]|uniref:hypothetical protein n=1 Tax=Sphingopyxis sp. LC363 TaxID=1120705 RepID=UPI00055AC1B3|nr:hypothetical protein [Sphingopyxis sp. LC363]
MSRQATSFVLGYHGCDSNTAEKLISGATSVRQSKQPYDWLGPGSYFWESDPLRAKEWADWRVEQGHYKDAAVIGGIIELGNCLDLAQRRNIKLVKGAYLSFSKQRQTAGLPMPENKSVKGQPNQDRILRFLDCAVFQHLHSSMEEAAEAGSSIPPFDTVRGVFTEGEPLYEGCGFFEKTHAQIAVLNPENIIGIFRPKRL